MLKPADLIKPRNKSGYNHVGFDGSKYWGTEGSKLNSKGTNHTPVWQGPRRNTAIEAAQDYCDRVNTQVLTIENIRNPKRKSGFNYVGSATGNPTAEGYRTQYWRGEKGMKQKGVPFEFRGPTRRTPEEAAQDYVDYINGQRGSTPATPALKSAGHRYTKLSIERDAEELAAIGLLRDRRAARAGRQGYVYLITDGEYLKIGHSVNPPARAPELQTGNARVLVVLATIKGTQQDERALQTKHHKHNVLQEWFTMETCIMQDFYEPDSTNFKQEHADA